MTQRYRMDLAYDGKRYKGWQRLGEDLKAETIQGKLETALSRILVEEIEIEGAGRTDAGVHALGQVATFSAEKVFDVKEVLKDLNFYLPEDMAVLKLEAVHPSFHARYSAVSKTYLYKILNTEIPDPFSHRYSLYLEESLDVAAMIRAAELFVGEHDFTAFTTAKSKKKSMVRSIERLEIVARPLVADQALNAATAHTLDKSVEIRITANGFLHNMARKITGTLIEIGLGRIPSEQAKVMLETGDRSLSSELAPAHGLYLERVVYGQPGKGRTKKGPTGKNSDTQDQD